MLKFYCYLNRAQKFIDAIMKSNDYKGKITYDQIKMMWCKSLQSLSLDNIDENEDDFEQIETKKQSFDLLVDEFRNCIYSMFNLPPFHYPHHALVDNHAPATVSEEIFTRYISNKEYEHRNLLLVFTSGLSED